MATPTHEHGTERVLDAKTMLAQFQTNKKEENKENPQLNLLLDQVTKMLQLLRIQNHEEPVTPQSQKKNRSRKGPAYERMVQNNQRLEMQFLVERARSEMLLEARNGNRNENENENETRITDNSSTPQSSQPPLGCGDYNCNYIG